MTKTRTPRTNSVAAKIREFAINRPELKASEIAASLGVPPAYVHSVLWKMKKDAATEAEVQKFYGAERAEEIEQRSKGLTPISTDSILESRGKRYGAFNEHAQVSQTLKMYISKALKERQKALDPDQKEALDMICHKIGRIINGDPNYSDSWHDIAGYAKLVADRLDGVVR